MSTRHCQNTSDYLLSDAPPDRPALVDARGHHTYGELRAAAGRLAAELARWTSARVPGWAFSVPTRSSGWRRTWP